MRFPALTVFAAVPLALAASAAPGPAPAGSTFAADPRLQSPLPLAAKDRPLADLVRDVAARCRVKLTTSRDTADDKATLFVDRRPAGETLAHIADQLGFIWVRSGEGWELTQSLSARRQEQERRLAELAPIRQEAEQIAAWSNTPKDQLEEQIQAIYDQMNEPGISPERRQALELKTQGMRRAAAAGPVMAHASLALFHSLQPAQLQRLLDGDRLRLSTAEGTIAPAFAEQIARFYRVTADTGPQKAAEMVVSLAESGQVAYGPPSRKDRTLALQIAYNSVRGEGANFEMISRTYRAGADQPPHAPAAIPDDPFFKQVVDLKLPVLKKDDLALSNPCPEAGRASLAYVWPAWPTVGDLAEALHQAGGPEIVADSFVSARFNPDQLRGKRTVGDVLRYLDAELDYTWRRDGHLILLRSRHYYRDRPAEAPNRLIRPWARRVSGKGEMSLDDLAELALALPDAQARSLDNYWGWYFQKERIGPPDWFFANRLHLRFWGGLNPAQREAARVGALPVSALRPTQQQAWLAAMTSPPRNNHTLSPLKHPLSEAELAAGGYSLRSRSVKEELWSHHIDGEKTYSVSRFVGSADRPVRAFKATQSGAPSADGTYVPATECQFRYHLAGEAKPASSTTVILPKAARAD